MRCRQTLHFAIREICPNALSPPTPSLADPLDARRIRFAEHVMRPGIEIRKVVGTRHGVISKAAREQLPGFGVEHDMFE